MLLVGLLGGVALSRWGGVLRDPGEWGREEKKERWGVGREERGSSAAVFRDSFAVVATPCRSLLPGWVEEEEKGDAKGSHTSEGIPSPEWAQRVATRRREGTAADAFIERYCRRRQQPQRLRQEKVPLPLRPRQQCQRCSAMRREGTFGKREPQPASRCKGRALIAWCVVQPERIRWPLPLSMVVFHLLPSEPPQNPTKAACGAQEHKESKQRTASPSLPPPFRANYSRTATRREWNAKRFTVKQFSFPYGHFGCWI